MSNVYALDCQYTHNQSFVIANKTFYHDSFLDEQIKISDFILVELNGYNVKVTNKLDKEVYLNVNYNIQSNWYGTQAGGFPATINPHDYYNFVDSASTSCADHGCHIEGLIFKIDRPNSIDVRLCNLCLGIICKNDGESCTVSQECGSNSCVQGYCSNTQFCYNNDCKCSSDKIQCNDNRRCVAKAVVSLDVKPECGKPQECVTGYIDSNNGLCAKSPSQLEAEKEQKLKDEIAFKAQQENVKKEQTKTVILGIIVILLIVIVGIVLYLYFKKKTIQEEIELVARKIEHKKYELHKIKKQITEIKKHNQLMSKEIERLNELKEKERKLLEEIKIQSEQIIKPFPDTQTQNRLVIINPYLGGYKCFYQKNMPLESYSTSTLVHRWVWKKYNGRDSKYGYHIHHIDGNKYNNNPKNLEEIDGKEHYEKHRSEFK
ncbi:HNH endonuclease [Candidatus Woesearchaeota archaeon]|nr:HNH endonuclease [Candidatus Woesearchaeota archaeon]